MKKPGWMFTFWAVLIAPQSAAETLRLEALTMTPEAVWQRGDARQEQEDGVYLLERASPEGTIQMAIPRQPTPVTHGKDVFFDHLRKKWGVLYGPAAHIDWFPESGARWLTCTRTTRDGATRVIQMATVHGDRAYGLIVFIPSGIATPPEQIMAPLLTGIRFSDTPMPGWRRIRVIPSRPDSLAQAMETENARIGTTGMVTGHGAEIQTEQGESADLVWFLEGFRWQADRQRAPLRLSGRLHAAAPARWHTDMALKAGLDLSPESVSVVEAQTRVWNLCAPRPALEAALAALARGDSTTLAALAPDRPSPCPPDTEHPPSYTLITRPGQTNAGVFSLDPPPLPLPSTLAELDRAGLAWRRIIGLTPALPEDTPGHGRVFSGN
jgi:hypothetical protein